MAIGNRDLDPSQQKIDYIVPLVTTVAASAGSYFPAFAAPFPCTVKAIRAIVNSFSGAPVIGFSKRWFVAGSGATTVDAVGVTFTATAYGTSGLQSVSLAAAGSTLLNLNTGDLFMVNQIFSGGNVAANAIYEITIQATQDIVTHFGT